MPAVYDFWTGRDGRGYLVMEFKDGEVLQRKWRKLSDPQKTSVFRILASYVEELRALHHRDGSVLYQERLFSTLLSHEVPRVDHFLMSADSTTGASPHFPVGERSIYHCRAIAAVAS